MKQTAVEWFAKELNNWRIKEFGEDSIIGIPQEVFEKAKQMEREQRIRDINFGHGIPTNVNINYEEYFKLTLKSE